MSILLWIAIGICALIFIWCWISIIRTQLDYVRIMAGVGIVITIFATIIFIFLLMLQNAFSPQ